VLTERGLEPAVVALVRRAPVPVDLAIELPKRVDAGIEAAAYFVISEALTNVAKYARAETVSVDVRSAGGSLLVTIADDGIGGAELDRGSGLRGLVDRVHAVGGTLDLSSPPGNGTRLSVQLPTKVLGSLNSH
jgi:signal transduction histidine kinase